MQIRCRKFTYTCALVATSILVALSFHTLEKPHLSKHRFWERPKPPWSPLYIYTSLYYIYISLYYIYISLYYIYISLYYIYIYPYTIYIYIHIYPYIILKTPQKPWFSEKFTAIGDQGLFYLGWDYTWIISHSKWLPFLVHPQFLGHPIYKQLIWGFP